MNGVYKDLLQKDCSFLGLLNKFLLELKRREVF